jgi:DNA/RNA endonuclease YhcR with UshA esterase domain
VAARSKNVAKKGVVHKKTVAKKSALQVVALSDIGKLPKGTSVQAEGIVTVTPGIFGDQYCVLTDEDGGIFVFQSKKNFPALALGDRVRVRGVLSESSGRKRITLSGSKNIDILSTNNRVEAVEKSVADISSDDAGSLVQVSGELTSKTTNRGFLDDGTDEILFSLKKGTAISTKNWRVGERITMTGVVVATKTGVELWPRQPDDVQRINSSTANVGLVDESQPNLAPTTVAWPSNLYIMVGGLLLTNAGLLWRLLRQKTVSKSTT